MVYLSTSEEWQRQSSLLLQARPTTTRITTKYKIPHPGTLQRSRKQRRGKDGNTANNTNDESTATESTPFVPRAVLVLKTFDPASGVCLKFRTDRAAEVGRLVGGLGKLGRYMAALPAQSEDVHMVDSTTATAPALDDDATTEIKPAPAPGVTSGGGSGGGGGTGGKKKKKNKK